MTKENRTYTVEITLHDGSTKFTAEDTDTSKAGYAAKVAIETKADFVKIPAETEGCTIYIPFCQILFAQICETVTEEKVEDDVCIPYTDPCGPKEVTP